MLSLLFLPLCYCRECLVSGVVVVKLFSGGILTGTSQYLECLLDRCYHLYVVVVSNKYSESRFWFVGCFIVIVFVVIVVVKPSLNRCLIREHGGKFVWSLLLVFYVLLLLIYKKYQKFLNLSSYFSLQRSPSVCCRIVGAVVDIVDVFFRLHCDCCC